MQLTSELHVQNQTYLNSKKNKQTCAFNHHSSSMSESSKPPRLETRSSNSNTHPGKNHLRYTATRRPTAEVTAEKEAKMAAKAEKLAKKQKGLQEAAEIEEKKARTEEAYRNSHFFKAFHSSQTE